MFNRSNLKSKLHTKNSHSRLYSRLTVIIILCFSALLSIYLHPTKEVMTCSQNYACTVEHEFINLVKISKNMQMNPKTTLSYNIKRTGSRGNYQLKIYFDNINPFIMYKSSTVKKNKIEAQYKITKDSFQEYLKNPNKTFKIVSYANPFTCYFELLVFLIIIFPLAVILSLKLWL